MAKRDRCANYSKKEEKLLLQCVLRKAAIIECRKTDATSSSTKNKAWADITSDYNCRAPENIRSEKQLRSKYKAVKKGLRQSAAAERRARQLTGGGKAPQECLLESEELQQLAAILSVSVNGLSPFFDDDQEFNDAETRLISTSRDASYTPNLTRPNSKTACDSDSPRSHLEATPIADVDGQEVTDIEITILSNDNTVLEESHASVSTRPHAKENIEPTSRKENVSPFPLRNWSEYTPSMLRKKAHPLLTRHNRKTADSNDLAAKKIEVLEGELSYIQLRKQHAMEEHNMRIQNLTEERELRMKEHNLRIQQSTKEHNLRLQYHQDQHKIHFKFSNRNNRSRTSSRLSSQSQSSSVARSSECNDDTE